jgi:hypothetical protein
MQDYTMECTCGDNLSVQAETRAEAVAKLQAGFTQMALDQHFAEKHPGQEKPSLEQALGMVQELVALKG